MNKMEPNSGRQEDSCQNCKILQKQFHYKQQEFLHLKDGHRRLQQVLAEKVAELSHAIRRAEINEREMRKEKLRLQESKTKESKSKCVEKSRNSTLKNKINCTDEKMKLETTENCDKDKEKVNSRLTETLQTDKNIGQVYSDSKFSEVFAQTIIDENNLKGPQNLDENFKIPEKEKITVPTYTVLNEPENISSDAEEIDAIYASVNKNRKETNKR